MAITPSPSRLTIRPSWRTTAVSTRVPTSRRSASAGSSPALSAQDEKPARSVNITAISWVPRPRPAASDSDCHTCSPANPSSWSTLLRSGCSADTVRPITSTGCAPAVDSGSPNCSSPGSWRRSRRVAFSSEECESTWTANRRSRRVRSDAPDDASRSGSEPFSWDASGVSSSSDSMSKHRPKGPEWREQDSNLRRLSREIYSLVPLTARVSRREGAESSEGRADEAADPARSRSVVLRPAEAESARTFGFRGRNEPASPVTHQSKQVVVSGRIEILDDPVPALVAAAGADGHVPAILPEDRRRLDLNPHDLESMSGDEVEVRTVADRHEHGQAALEQPRDRRALTLVALPAWVSSYSCFHARRLRLAPDGKPCKM